MADNVLERKALNVDTLPVGIITFFQMLHFLEVGDWLFNFALTSKRCLRLYKQAHMPKTAVIKIRSYAQVVLSFIPKLPCAMEYNICVRDRISPHQSYSKVEWIRRRYG
jgi:hypothetical protein